MFWAGTPRPTDSAPCGSRSMSSTRRPYSTRAAPRLMVDVVLPTPPFWLHIAMMRAGPWPPVRGGGSGRGRCRAFAGSDFSAAAPISGSVSCGRATAELAASARIAMVVVASTSSPVRLAPGAVSRPYRSGATNARERERRYQGGTPGPSCPGDVCQRIRQLEPKRLWVPYRTARPVWSCQGPRVRAGIDLAQPIDGHQRVDLRRRHRGVAEQFLHHPDVGAAVEQVRGERVP